MLPLLVMHAQQGSLILPAVRTAVSLAAELRVRRLALTQLEKADKVFPKMRGTSPSQAYAEFTRLVGTLR